MDEEKDRNGWIPLPHEIPTFAPKKNGTNGGKQRPKPKCIISGILKQEAHFTADSSAALLSEQSVTKAMAFCTQPSTMTNGRVEN